MRLGYEHEVKCDGCGRTCYATIALLARSWTANLYCKGCIGLVRRGLSTPLERGMATPEKVKEMEARIAELEGGAA